MNLNLVYVYIVIFIAMPINGIIIARGDHNIVIGILLIILQAPYILMHIK